MPKNQLGLEFADRFETMRPSDKHGDKVCDAEWARRVGLSPSTFGSLLHGSFPREGTIQLLIKWMRSQGYTCEQREWLFVGGDFPHNAPSQS